MLPNSNASLDDIVVPSNESSRTDLEVCTYSPEILNLDVNWNRRYPLCKRREPDSYGFSKSSNVVYLISDFVSIICLRLI